MGGNTEQYVSVVESHLVLEKLEDISDYDKRALYDTQYPVIY